jgi:phosphatidylserine decarboxylase
MKIHREGSGTIMLVMIVLAFANALALYFGATPVIITVAVSSLVFLGFILYFFRVPNRTMHLHNDFLIAPADGKIVVIEEVEETEYLQAKVRQMSIFMSPLNVHINWNPCSGSVVYKKYHPGKYMVAWHPKSSSLNERTTVVYQIDQSKIMMKQIAGAVARRIVNYLIEGDQVEQGKEMGFIKFGSRVDILMPIEFEVLVDVNQNVKGGVTPLAKLS